MTTTSNSNTSNIQPDLISVIVPVYNVEKYLTRCIDSIIAQTYKNLEIIIVDDGSTDSSGLICDNLASIDNRIKVIHQKNAGLACARNTGLEIYKGEYVCFIDSDDFIHPEYINTMYTLCIAHSCKMAICESFATNSFDYKNDSELASEYRIYSSMELLKDYYSDMHCTIAVAWNKLIHRSVISDIFFEPGIIHEDEATTFKYIYYAHQIAYTPNQLYYYFQRDNSITDIDFSEKNLDILIGYRNRLTFYKNHKESALFSRECNYYLAAILTNYYKVYYLISDNSALLKRLHKLYQSACRDYLSSVDSLAKKPLYFICIAFPLLYGLIKNKFSKPITSNPDETFH